MNLHGIVSGAIATVNPFVPISIQLSTGQTTNADGSRTPSYADPIIASAQVQELTSRDLSQLQGLNLQMSQKAIYISGTLNGVVRVTREGGDLITFEDGTVWLTTTVLEQWPDWVKVSVTLQNDSV